jgi:hypothetical protein
VPQLVLINGPIASGKSALARALGHHLREHGRGAAVVDLDLLFDMLDHGPKSDEAVWRRARLAAAVLADHFWSSGVEVVVVEGHFWTDTERAALVDHLATPVRPRVVTLRVSFREALRRARSGPTRGLSRDPAFLAANHAGFEALLGPLHGTDLVVDAESATPAQIAATLAALLAEDAGPG